ncbi:MAG: YqhA family protein [Acidimicrobiia bacterium]
MDTIFRSRYVSIVAVVFGAIGAVTMFIIGSVTTLKGIYTYFGGRDDQAFSSDAALTTTIDMITALDQFILGLVLLVFAYGVYALWIAPDTDGDREERPSWLSINSVTDLKVVLLEVVAVLLAVLFLKGVLENTRLSWPDLVVPLAVALFAATIWLIRKAH